jgi:hypothetical protein
MMHTIVCYNYYADNIQGIYHALRDSNFPLPERRLTLISYLSGRNALRPYESELDRAGGH